MWVQRRNLEMEVLSDPKLELSTMLIGTCDLSEYFLTSKSVRLGAPLLGAKAGIAIISKEGILKSRLVVPDIGNVLLTVKDIERMAGLIGAESEDI
jgi:hypothetical protein